MAVEVFGGLDGVIAKRADGPYAPGKRMMAKIKHARTADCVVGGVRYLASRRQVGSRRPLTPCAAGCR